ncbi:MAG: site-specific DNA-methyltransferase, partial [Eubacterium sp.]|nr:site-specific DNA-methyltransferase [Eubacterium sp.]
MPSLNWIGKDKVLNHHNEVPYRVLNKKYSYGDDDAGNMIIHGDNLEALKSLLPKYEGKVKCIYIDPPYNTGNEGWIYNDNVNDPQIRKWLGEVVGKEDEDLTRHDKWLCMMYPRLRLLHKILANDGVIFISIDDNEQTYLRMICDEIFGTRNFLSMFIWHSRQRADSRNISNVSVDHEYVLAYSKTDRAHFKGRQIDISKYKNPDNDPRGPWASIDLSGLANAQQRPNLHYDIVDPKTGIVYPPNPNRGWSKSKDTLEKMLSENRILFPKSPTGRPREKKFLKDLQKQNTGFSSVLVNEEVGYTTEGTRAVRSIFEGPAFDFPKSVKLVETLIKQVTDENSIVLDSFAGSGTTAHAVLNANKTDDGNRRFILVEMGDYADSITAERVKRVIDGYGEGNKKVEGIGGGFSFYELGEQLLIDNENINPDVDNEIIREYIWYMETRKSYERSNANDNPYYLGLHNDTAYYFNYEKDRQTVLDNDFLKTIKTRADAYVIYADTCNLSDTKMNKYNITFK